MIEISQLFNSICASAYTTFVGTIFKNILYTSIFLAIIVLIIVCCVRNTRTFLGAFQLVVYIFIATLIVLVFHQAMMDCRYKEIYKDKMSEEVLNAVRGGNIIDSNRIEVAPKISESEPQDDLDQALQDLGIT